MATDKQWKAAFAMYEKNKKEIEQEESLPITMQSQT
jgi:hypothetical protein